jgi:glutathione S-transferase
MALIVYGSRLSPFVRKVRVVLEEKGVPYTHDEKVNPFSPSPEFKAISPLSRIPVLRDTDHAEPNTLADSSIICDYIEHKFPTPALYPSDPFDRARALWFEEYADSALAEWTGRGFFFERVVKKMMRGETDEAICQRALTEKLPPLFEYLEQEIGANTYLVGGAFSIADIAVATMIVNFEHGGGAIDTARWPHLAAHVKRIHERASFKTLVEAEHAIVKRYRAA